MTFEEFKSFATGSPTIPLSRTLIADMLTPVAAYLRIRRSHRSSFLFESVEGGERLGRYSFIGFDPEIHYQSHQGNAVSIDASGKRRSFASFLGGLQELTASFRQPRVEGLPPFTGGLVGYIGYDIVREIESIPTIATDPSPAADAMLGLFTKVIAFDHLHHQATLIVNVRPTPSSDLRAEYDRALAALDAMQTELFTQELRRASFAAPAGGIVPEMSAEEFRDKVLTVKKHIRDGDIFQLVLSQRFRTACEGDPFQVYRALRIINPSPYLYVIDCGELQILGSSPEVLVRVQERDCEVYPIAGTRRRGATPEEDRALEVNLRSDAKELAEHIMLVDLGRNDLGRICEAGSVSVKESMFLVQYSHVMHLASRVAGRLLPGISAVEVIRATFPAGTVSGAPKIRAMELIETLEPGRRGIYAGGVGYIDFSGNLDLCIAIRTLVARNREMFFQAGAGIVADSDPALEYDETLNKAMAMREAIRMAGSLSV
jgi:anthranilate synthase component 1